MTTQIPTWLPHAGEHLIPGQVRIGGLWHEVATAEPGLITTTDGRRLTGDVHVVWRVSQAPVPGSVQQRWIEDHKAEQARQEARRTQKAVEQREQLRWRREMARLESQARAEAVIRDRQAAERRYLERAQSMDPLDRYLGTAGHG